MNEDLAKQAWQTSVEIAGAPPLDEVRREADKFYRSIWWRNLVEYAACVIVVAGFTSYVFTLPDPLQKIGSVLVVLATLYVAWQLHRRASAVRPEAAGTMPLLLFARLQMVRQRDALRSLFSWYILPFLPGLAMVAAGNWRADPASGSGWPNLAEALAFAVMFGMPGFIWWINQLGARRLQKQIDEIDALIGDDA